MSRGYKDFLSYDIFRDYSTQDDMLFQVMGIPAGETRNLIIDNEKGKMSRMWGEIYGISDFPVVTITILLDGKTYTFLHTDHMTTFGSVYHNTEILRLTGVFVAKYHVFFETVTPVFYDSSFVVRVTNYIGQTIYAEIYGAPVRQTPTVLYAP